MKITKSWRSGGYLSVKFLGGLLGLGMVFGFLVPMVRAEGSEVTVVPGAGNLKTAVESAEDGTTIKLQRGSYSGSVNDRTINIDHSITIEGAGGMSRQSIVDVPFKITKPGVTVTLKGFSTSMTQVEDNFTYIQVAAENVTLNLEDLNYDGILRGMGNGRYPDLRSHVLDITESADHANVTIKDSSFYKTGTKYAVWNKASNATVTLDNSTLGSRTPIMYENGSENKLYINNNSVISGPAMQYQDNEVIAMKGQEGLTIEVNDSKIDGQWPSGHGPVEVFAFDDEAPSSDVEIKIKGSEVSYTAEDGKEASASTIFVFGKTMEAGSAKMTIDNNSEIYRSVIDSSYKEVRRESISIERWYRNPDNVAVIGIYDREGNSTVQLYADGAEIEALKSPDYIEQEGYNFKGWFKTFDGKTYDEQYTEPYTKAAAGTNMNLYPKFAKKIDVTIGEDVFHLEEGDTLGGGKIEELEGKLEALKQPGMTFKGYDVYGETTSQTFGPEDLESLKAYQPSENVKIEAIHRVTLTVNGKKFELDAGDTIDKIGTHEGYETDEGGYETARLDGNDEEHFSRLVYVGGELDGTTFDPTGAINQDAEVKTKHHAILTVEDQEFKVEQGEKISNDKDGKLLETLKAIKERPVEYKTFNRFENDKNEKIEIEGEVYTVPEDSEDMTITPKYHVAVKIGEQTYEFDEGGKLSDLSEKQDEIKGELGKLVTGTGEQNFKGFVIATTDGPVRDTITATKDNASEKYDDILNEEIEVNTTIYAEYNVEVTIKCPENACDGNGEVKFQIDTGKTLKNIEENDSEKYQKAKLQEYFGDQYESDRFVKFVLDNGDEFGEEQPIERSITLTPKYYMIVTIDDERGDVKGTYKVEQGKTIDEMVSLANRQDNVEDVLLKLRNDIVPDEEDRLEAKDLHFEKIVKTKDGNNGAAFEGAINEDIELKGVYHYDVVIVEDYDNPDEELGDVDAGRYGFKVYRGESLESNEQAETALDKLSDSVNKEDKSRKFVKFLDTKTGLTYDKETILDKVFDRHVYINAQAAYRVEIDGDDTLIYVVNGEKMNTTDGLLEAELSELADKPGKHLETYTLDGVDITRDDLLASTVQDKAVKVGAKYYVEVTIDGEKFKIPENGKLGESDQKAEIEQALKRLEEKIKSEGQSLDEYSVGKDIDAVLEYEFATDAEVVAKSKIDVKIDETDYSSKGFMTGDTIIDKIGEETLNSDHKNKFEPDKVFSRFVNKETNETFDENTALSKKVELVTKYAFKITIDGDDSYRLEEEQALNSNEKIMAKIREFKNNSDKTFLRLTDGEGNMIEESQTLSKHTEIKPVYGVTITIEGKPFQIEENKALNIYNELETLTNYLATLDSNLSDKVFDKYLVDGHEFTREELLAHPFADNAEVTVRYNVEVTLGNSKVTVPQGSKLFESNDLKNAMSNAEVPSNKSSIARFTDQDGKIVDDEYTFNANTELKPQYMVKVYIEGTSSETEGEEIEEGSMISAATKSIEELRAKDATEQKRFKESFVRAELVLASVEIPVGGKMKPSDTIDENVKLTPEYEIDVTVEGDKKYTVDDGTTLQNLVDGDYVKPEGFRGFKDAEGNPLQLEDPLHKHITVIAVYDITITLPNGKTITLEAGKRLNELAGEELQKLEALKNDSKGRDFSRFIDKNTGKTVKEDEPLFASFAIEPRFLNKVTISAQDDDGKTIEGSEDLGLNLEEGLPLSGLSEDENKKLQNWIGENRTLLEEAGKPSYDLAYYLDENGDIVNASNPLENEAKLIAVFAYTPEPTPLPEPTPSESETNAGAPDTGSEAADEVSANMGDAAIVILAVLASATMATIVYRRHRKSEAK